MLRATRLAPWILVAALASALPLRAQCTPTWLPGDPIPAVLGVANAVTSWDPDGVGPLPAVLVAGGNLSGGMALDRSVLFHDGAGWASLGSPPVGETTALAQFNGELIAAIRAPSFSTTDVVAWNGSTWRQLGVVAGHVRSFALHAGALYAGGSFTSVAGVGAQNIARFDGTAWTPLGSGVTGVVLAMQSFNNALYVGGELTAAGGTPIGNLAIWNGTSFLPGIAMNGTVRAMAARIGTSLANSYLFVGGDFWVLGTAPNTMIAHAVARFSPSANAWSAMGTTLNGNDCYSLLVRSNGLSSYTVSCGITTGLQLSAGVAQWNGTTWDQVGTLSLAYAITNHLGVLTVANNQTLNRRRGAVVHSYVGGVWIPPAGPGASFDGSIEAVLTDGADALIGGSAGVQRGRPGAWQMVGSSNDNVLALARLASGELVAGGRFTTIGGVTALRVARFDGTAWHALGGGVAGDVRALLPLPDGQLIVGGEFILAGGAPANYVARWDGNAWHPLSGGTDGPVHALVRLPDGQVVAGGAFTYAGTFNNRVDHIARWNGSTWSSIGSGFDAEVDALAILADGSLVAGGQITRSGGVAIEQPCRWNGTSWSAFSPGNQRYGIQALVPLPQNDLVIVEFNLAAQRSSPSTTTVLIEGDIRGAALAADGDVLVGGDLLGADGVVSFGFARLDVPCPATAIVGAPGCSSTAGPVTLTATDLPWLGGTSRARVSGIPANSTVFGLVGLFTTNLPLAAVLAQAGPGCNLLVDPVLAVPLPVTNGTATLAVPLPADITLAGVVLHEQALPFTNAVGGGLIAVTASNALAVTLGWM